MKKENWTRRIQVEEVDRRGGDTIGGIDRLVKQNTTKNWLTAS